jgi:translation initiation factor IF-3
MSRRSTVRPTLLLAANLLLLQASAFAPFGVVLPVRQPYNTELRMAKVARNNRQPPVKEVRPPMNEQIDNRDLRVVTPTARGKDEPLGIMTRDEALAKAKEMGGLDLILVNANSDPPVCKIVDYSKYRYSQEKKAKEVKKNSKATEIKEVKISYKIDVYDYTVRKKSAAKFLGQGNRVKCTVMFRGREVQHENLGFEILEKLSVDLEPVCVREGRAKREGRALSLILSPRPEVLKAANDRRKAQEKARKKIKDEERAKRIAAGTQAIGADGEYLDDDDDDEDDFDDDDNDDDGDLDSSLDDLFGSDDLTDDLFS